MHQKMIDFMISGSQTRSRDRFKAQGSALTRNELFYMARRTCFQRAILYRHKRYYCVKEDCRPRPAETIYKFGMVIGPYLLIDQLV